MIRRGSSLLFATAIALAATTASAQPVRDPAMAEALFKSAKDLLKKGDWSTACAKFQASMDLDPAASTLLRIAQCHEHEGKLTAALYDTQRALKLNRELSGQSDKRRKELEEYANTALAALEKRVPKLRIIVSSPPPGLTLTRNGQPLPTATLGEALPADPGSLEIVAEAPGYALQRKVAVLTEGKETTLELSLTRSSPPPVPKPVPEPVPDSSQATLKASPPPKPTTSPVPPATLPAPNTPDIGRNQRVVGFVVGGVGIAGLGAAGIFGIQTMTTVNAASDKGCDASRCTKGSEGAQLIEDARMQQTTALVFLGVGAAVLGTGIALYTVAPRKRPGVSAAATTVAVVANPGGVSVRGTW